MKRLLAYLFIVLGLGLTFSVSAAKKIIVPDFSGYACVYPIKTYVNYATWSSLEIPYKGENTFSVVMNNITAKFCSQGKQYLILKSDYPIQFSKLEKYAGKNISIKDLLNIVEGTLLYKTISSRKSNKIITKEANETRYTEKKNDWRKKFELIQNKKEPSQTQITQTESSQTLKVENPINPNKNYNIVKINFCVDSRKRRNDKIFPALIDRQECSSLNYSTYYTSVKFKPSNYQNFLNQTKLYKSKRSTDVVNSNIGNKNIICFNIKSKKVSRSTTRCFLESGLYEVKYDGKNFYWGSGKTQIAKAETTVKPKKKVKVAKVAEPKQEEFKPKITNQDNEAPVIEIAEAITVDSQAYTLKGKVKDKSQIYLTINGRQVDVKKGKFELDRFNIDPDVAEELKIVAIDQWNNKSEKIVKVTIDLQSTVIAKVYEELKPNNVKVKTDKNKIAIIIGIEKYANLKNLDAKYANRDAQAFRTYATRALGIKPSNIKVLIDDKANRGNTLEAFKIWLPKKAGKGGKDIHIFFAGHGLASENGKDLYILPQDGNAKLLDDTAITRVELISLINKVNPKSVTMFFDTCYSGQTRDERMLVASLLRPIQIISEEQDTPDNFTIFSASDYDQVSGGIEEAKHGMFSYYLMKGLEGKADDNKDKKITNGELITYLKDNVSEEAFTQNREQDPMLAGDPDKILISYQ